ncbi:hypothetical protein V8C35DRAFT_319150 [Trichoderma chlorosporum]
MADLDAEIPITLRAPFPFQPDPFQRHQMSLFGQDKVPRYLFHFYTPSTHYVGLLTNQKCELKEEAEYEHHCIYGMSLSYMICSTGGQKIGA